MMTKTGLLVLASLLCCAATAQPLPNSWMRGTVTFALDSSAFGSLGTQAQIATAREAWPELTHVALQWMWCMETATSNTVSIRPHQSPTIANVTSVVRFAHSLGLRVLLKPLVVARNGIQMFELAPSDPAAWFASYSALMKGVFDMANEENVDAVSVGLELLQLVSNQSNVPHWQSLIATGRARCPSCRLTYCSNPLTPETSSIAFWPQLDFVGLDLYIPFVFPRDPNATVVLPDAATMNTHFAVAMEKPKLVITESGYPSSNLGMQSPWLLPTECTTAPSGNASVPFANYTAQAAAFEVMFAQLSQPSVREYYAGFFQFWTPTPGSPDYPEASQLWACSFPVLRKPAGDLIAAAFARAPAPQPRA